MTMWHKNFDPKWNKTARIYGSCLSGAGRPVRASKKNTSLAEIWFDSSSDVSIIVLVVQSTEFSGSFATNQALSPYEELDAREMM